MVTKTEPASPATPPRAGLTYRPNVDVRDRGSTATRRGTRIVSTPCR